MNDPPSNEEQQQSQQEQRSRRDGLPAGWRYYDQAKHRSRLRGWLAQVWRGAKNNAALLSLVGVLLTLLVTTLLTQLEWSQQQKLENQRAEAERELAAQRAQDETLQAYLDQMSNLLIEKDLRNSYEDSEVRTLARVRTLTALETLDPSRKTAVVQFLVEDGLVQRVEGRDPIIGRGPIIGLSGADLSNADLSGADLRGADLGYVDLRGADLIGADLIGADLSSAAGITNEELELQAKSLRGATMPNGQKYEDWLKSKDQEENKKSDGSS